MGPNGVKRCLLTQDVVFPEWGFIEYYLNEIIKNCNNTVTSLGFIQIFFKLF